MSLSAPFLNREGKLLYALLSVIFALVIKNKIPFLKRAPQKIFTKINMKPALAGLFNTGAVIAEMRALQMSEIGRVEALTKLSLIITLFLEFVLIKRQFCKIRFTAVLLILLGSVGAVITF